MTYEEFWEKYQRDIKEALKVFFKSDDEWDRYIKEHMEFNDRPNHNGLRKVYDYYVDKYWVEKVHLGLSALVYSAEMSY